MPSPSALLRTLVSSLAAGAVRKELARYPLGISAMVRVKDEEEWVYHSLLSLAPHVDEIAIADVSTDGSWERIQAFIADHGANVPVRAVRMTADGDPTFRTEWDTLFTTELYTVQSNLALRLCRYRVVLRWDADYIASPHLADLRTHALQLASQSSPWYMMVRALNLEGDLHHMNSGSRYNFESRLHTNAGHLHYRSSRGGGEGARGRFEMLRFPAVYRKSVDEGFFAFHMNSLKPARRLLARFFWTDWREALARDPATPARLEDYISREAAQRWGITGDLDSIACHYVNRVLPATMTPYDAAHYGPLPALAAPGAHYRMVKDAQGTILGRNDCL